MTFVESALVLAWIAIVLLALGYAGLLRQVGLLSRARLGGDPGGSGGPGGAGPGGARTTRDLVGFRLPDDSALEPLVPTRGERLTVFVSPGCPSCQQTLARVGADPVVGAGRLELSVVSTGSCAPAEEALAGRGRCRPEGRDLLDRLLVPATPYLVLVDAAATVRAALLPDADTDLSAWVRQAVSPPAVTQESR